MTPRFKPLLVATLALIALTATIPSAASARRGLEVAVQDDAALVTETGTIGDRVKALDLAAGLNATWVRANVNWSYVVDNEKSHNQNERRKQPKHIRYNWTGYDALIAEAAARGMHVQLSLTGPAPAWATGNHRVGHVKPKAKPFKRFARDAAKHFRGRVTRYSIWNEPNYVGWISPLKAGPRIYRKLYIAGYGAIKKANRHAKVFIGETQPFKRNSTAPLAFLRKVTCANSHYRRAHKCKRLKTDGYAHHPYDFRHKPSYRYRGKDNVTLKTLPRLTRALSKLRKARLLSTPGGGVPYIYLTEYGYFASDAGKYSLPEKKRAKYLKSAFAKAVRNRRVKQLLQFGLLKPDSKFQFFATYLATAAGAPLGAYGPLAAWIRRAVASGKVAGLH